MEKVIVAVDVMACIFYSLRTKFFTLVVKVMIPVLVDVYDVDTRIQCRHLGGRAKFRRYGRKDHKERDK